MNSHDVSETAPRKGQTKKKNFGRSTSATLLCVVWRRLSLELIAFLAGNFGYLGELDIYDVCDKRGVAAPTGNQARNECYYQLIKPPGVTGG